MNNGTFQSFLADLDKKVESEHIEPGLLSVFRMVIGLLLAISAAALTTTAIYKPELNLTSAVIWTVGWMVFLIIYLSSSWLRHRLGRWYLPIALTIVTLLFVLPRTVFIIFNRTAQIVPNAEISDNGWRLLLVLLIPLVFGAWQYRFVFVALFSAIITLVNFTTGLIGYQLEGPIWPELIEQTLIGFIIFLLIGYVITQLVRTQHEKQQALAEANAQVVAFATTAEQLATSRERNRLARDLHDTLAHTLSAISVQLEAVDSTLDHSPVKAREVLGKTLANTRDGLNETRRALRALRASPLDDLGLALAVRTLAESTADRSRLNLKVAIPHELVLTPAQEQNIYRIAQESVENVVRHANARNLTVELYREDDKVILLIRDDGHGFQLVDSQESGHFGLQGMRERAQLIGATLDITSTADEGTTVRLELPVTAKEI